MMCGFLDLFSPRGSTQGLCNNISTSRGIGTAGRNSKEQETALKHESSGSKMIKQTCESKHDSKAPKNY